MSPKVYTVFFNLSFYLDSSCHWFCSVTKVYSLRVKSPKYICSYVWTEEYIDRIVSNYFVEYTIQETFLLHILQYISRPNKTIITLSSIVITSKTTLSSNMSNRYKNIIKLTLEERVSDIILIKTTPISFR